MPKLPKYKGSKQEAISKAEMDEKALYELEQSEGTNREEFFEEEIKQDDKERREETKKTIEVADLFSNRWNYEQFIVDKANEYLKKILADAVGFRAVCVRTRDRTPITVFGENISGNYLREGILIVVNHRGKNFVKSMRLSRDAIIDVGALNTLMVMVENTIDSLGGKLESDKERIERTTGLILP